MEWNWRVTFKHPANQDQSLKKQFFAIFLWKVVHEEPT
jgi:hypothetical protein